METTTHDSTESERSPAPDTCPRCGGSRSEDEYYGVCPNCRVELRSVFDGSSRDVAEVEYEPKMNVTPNAVASKE
ncbi:MAG: hypothetical protein ACR2P0_18300 [Acidimicrobiales bacterium]